jgi:hypothetical protein
MTWERHHARVSAIVPAGTIASLSGRGVPRARASSSLMEFCSAKNSVIQNLALVDLTG